MVQQELQENLAGAVQVIEHHTTEAGALRAGISVALDMLTKEADEYDDDSGTPPRELEFIRHLSAHLNGVLIEADLPPEPAADAIDKGWGDWLLQRSDGSNFGTLEELQEELIGMANDLQTGTQSVADWARQPSTKDGQHG